MFAVFLAFHRQDGGTDEKTDRIVVVCRAEYLAVAWRPICRVKPDLAAKEFLGPQRFGSFGVVDSRFRATRRHRYVFGRSTGTDHG